jgi:hypothetical protein
MPTSFGLAEHLKTSEVQPRVPEMVKVAVGSDESARPAHACGSGATI